jgi:AcrR family transcriptional regulator
MPKIVNREKKRSEIARRAIEILAKRGFQATTIQDIADAAGLGKGTIYHYFDTKEEILLAVSGEVFRQVERSLGAALLRLDEPMEKLSALIEESLRVTEDVEYVFIVYTELWLMNVRNDHYSDFMRVFRCLHHDLREIVTRLLEEGKKKGLLADDFDSGALAVYLIASWDGVIAHYLMDKKSFDLSHVTREFIRFLLRQGAVKA